MMQSPLMAAWDVHLDGSFDPKLQEHLITNDSYILLQYRHRQGQLSTTLTLHFLQQQECIREYKRMAHSLKQYGGFSGQLYWEDPLAFAVYGTTIPRSIVY